MSPLRLIPISPTPSHAAGREREDVRGLMRGLMTSGWGLRACPVGTWITTASSLQRSKAGVVEDLLTLALMGLEGWPLRVLVCPFHLVPSLVHLCQSSLPQILQL